MIKLHFGAIVRELDNWNIYLECLYMDMVIKIVCTQAQYLNRRIFVVSNTLFSVIKPNTLLCCWFCARVYKWLSSDIVVFTDVLEIWKYLLSIRVFIAYLLIRHWLWSRLSAFKIVLSQTRARITSFNTQFHCRHTKIWLEQEYNLK